MYRNSVSLIGFAGKDAETKAVHVSQFFIDAAAGNLPSFSLVDPYSNFSEENGDISVGEGYAALVIDAVMKGPAWTRRRRSGSTTSTADGTTTCRHDRQ